MNEPIVLLVHSIDAEGPLREPIEATFERLREVFGITGIAPTKDNLLKLKQKNLEVRALLSEHALTHHETWEQIDAMLEHIGGADFRHALTDSFGGGWVYNWHCLDHVGFESNERHRDLGYHKVFDRYARFVSSQLGGGDALHYHFHYISTFRDAHRCATSFLNSAHEFMQVLCRRIIERHWFPRVARAGFQCERPDSHWFLEQWIPYDLSNMSLTDNTELDKNLDFRLGRSGNWRQAPHDWSIYHPSHDNYQIPGNCRRWIGRALNVMSRVGALTPNDLRQAFARADQGLPTLVGISGHDWRDLGREVGVVRSLIQDIAPSFPQVKFKYCEAVEAFRWASGARKEAETPLDLEIVFERQPSGDVPRLTIKTRKGQVFGPQPFLAIETIDGRFVHDNLDFSTLPGVWHYAFHGDTLPLQMVKRIGIAANDSFANSFVKVLEIN